MSIRATNYEVQEIGSFFKSSKLYRWHFQLADKQHLLELDYTPLTGKRQLILDGRKINEAMQLSTQFQYPFSLEGYAMNVIQQGVTFEFRINNKVFSHLYTQYKTENEFVYEDDAKEEAETKKEIQNEFTHFSSVPQNKWINLFRKFTLNFRLEKSEIDNLYDQKQEGKPQNYDSEFGFGIKNDFEEFQNFGQQSKDKQQKQEEQWGDFTDFKDFSRKESKKQKEVRDLLDLDDEEQQSEQSYQPQQLQQPQQQQQQQQEQKQQQPQQQQYLYEQNQGISNIQQLIDIQQLLEHGLKRLQ